MLYTVRKSSLKKKKMNIEKILTSDFIKSSRLRHKLTQEELAKRLGVSFATVNRWENGKTRPSPLARRYMEELFEVITR